jgi:flagellar hook protein FlgE
MLTSFSTALSALGAHSTAIDVVGNNLSNLNTPGFKTSVVSFHDLVTQSLGAGLGETQVGFGVGRPITLRQFSQGAIQSSGGPMDAAIQGDGFFIVKDQAGQTLYTRGGNMQVDQQGHLTTATGEKVQGWTISADGSVDANAAIGDIVVAVGALNPPTPTKNISLDLNLNSAGVAGEQSGTFSTSQEVFDSLGNSHMVTFTFTKSATPNQWHYEVTVPDADLTSGFTPLEGDLTFDGNGKLQSPGPDDAMPQIDITGLADGAADMSIMWSMFTKNGTPRITQYSQTSSVSANAQDGSPAANLTRIGLADGGRIVALYSNGQQTVVGQMALALVKNPESLIAVGNNNYQLSARSADPAVGLPNTGGRGSVLGGAVEASTVDIAKEFTNLIVYQRGYQANARVVTAVDELSQETINLKR